MQQVHRQIQLPMRNTMSCSTLSKMPEVHNGYIRPAPHKKAGAAHTFQSLLPYGYNKLRSGIQMDKFQLQTHHSAPSH